MCQRVAEGTFGSWKIVVWLLATIVSFGPRSRG
jgi:hypothetical protein